MSTNIKELFLKLTSVTTPNGNEKLMEPYLPAGWKNDFYGNYYYVIGESKTMFTSHLDTADQGGSKPIIHEFQGDNIKTDGKTILGADDKAGVAVMIAMIEAKVPGLYYFFLGEERHRLGSTAVAEYIKKNKDNELYKNINKVISFDRSRDESVITYQNSERCCSENFANQLSAKLNEHGFKYKPDSTGLYTDSYSFIELYSECTNLSVGYENQHAVREVQDIVFLQKLADACCKIDWESLKTERDHTKTEYKRYGSYGGTTYTGNYGGRNRYYDGWEEDDWFGYATPTRSTSSSTSDKYVTDYMGDKVEKDQCVWCEFDKVWCKKDEAIWVEYVGFYVSPDVDPEKVKAKAEEKRLAAAAKSTSAGTPKLQPMTKDNIVKGSDVYVGNKKWGKIKDVVGNHVRLEVDDAADLLIPIDKAIADGSYSVTVPVGTNNVTKDNIENGMIIKHNSFGEGKVISINADKTVAKIQFQDAGIRDIFIQIANMKF